MTVDGVQVFGAGELPARENRRNLFAFTETHTSPRTQSVSTIALRSTETPQVAENDKPVAKQDPEFPMRFIGTFGFDRDPIAVFAANGEIVNAKVGDVVAGEYRLASIGLETVDLSTPQGRTQRISTKR